MANYPIILGILQGLFEWLPISSQGNLVLLSTLFLGLQPIDAINYAIFLHTGTLLSVLVYFRRDINNIVWNLKKYKPRFDSDDNRLISFLIISTFVTGVVGFATYTSVTMAALTGELFIGVVGISLIITGLLQKYSKGLSDFYRKLNFNDSILLGLLQGISVIPGISRSGITVSGFLLRNYTAEKALKYSFLMSIPAILAAEIGLVILNGIPNIPMGDALLGLLAAFFTGLASIHVLLRVAQKVKFWKFCIVIGVLALVPLLFYLF
jgi:undecaprenyl-diphosphatase